ncbi:NUDIX domain-containing protein [Endozoicomonas elysicola]|uniref:ADP-ribose pyrophosphatase n=1 Tax=Endozoicomonas elysicola TaxID=305900 RepID=A0A081K6D9_9GAMM|nr:NUDIX domain-containing protein [Endozoicomonas elysicola]KEI69715.1 ADP-ribose pyrophosphatase [Endozoicomonas elysicola]
MKLSGLDASDVQVQEETKAYSGFLKLFKYTITHGLFKGGVSRPLIREATVRPPSVGVILFDPLRDQVVLVEQFRMGPFLSEDDPWLLEVVAGISEPGETLEEVALREVEEETGYKVTSLMPVSDFYVSPGASNEKLKLFCGLVDASIAGGIFGVADEGEDIKVHVLPFPEAYDMVEDGRIANAPAVIALQWLKLHHHELCQHEK